MYTFWDLECMKFWGKANTFLLSRASFSFLWREEWRLQLWLNQASTGLFPLAYAFFSALKGEERVGGGETTSGAAVITATAGVLSILL